MKYSIIIPTYNKWEEALKPCLESLFQYTNINGLPAETEVIVVANGCTDATLVEISKLKQKWHNLKLVGSVVPLGYTKAINKGLEYATGEFVVLLNNDTIFLPQNVDDWLNILNKPFEDKTVAVTGPMLTLCEAANRKFLIFFCVMIRRIVFEEIGVLDEIFSPGYGEDSDFCFRAEDHGYKVVQVPEASEVYYAEKRMTGNFPIYHEGNVTFKNWPDGDKLIERNNNILRERYYIKAMPPELPQTPVNAESYGPVYIREALKCDGYMSDKELEWLATVVRERTSVAEIGSWHGRSTRALADNIICGTIYAIDHWNGSEAERDTNHRSARNMNGDAAFYEFCQNLAPFMTGEDEGPLLVLPLRMSSENAARLFSEKKKTFDMIFIDAGHTYEEVLMDIRLWAPLLDRHGILCGHDYYPDGSGWPGVKKAVDEVFGSKVYGVPGTSIWVVQGKDIPVETKKVPVIDCFPFNNELDILEIRLNELGEVVDRFVIVEATRTHGNKTKPLNFHNNLSRFQKFLHKITYIVVDDYVAYDSWSIERHQRNRIMSALKDCPDDAVIIIGDVDEIPKAEAIRRYDPRRGLCCIEQDLFYYSYNCRAKEKWRWARVLPYAILKNMSPCEVRYIPNYAEDQVIKDGGWHFSYIGDVDAVIKKIEDSAHQEYNTGEFKNREIVARRMAGGKDLYGRPIEFELLNGGSHLPRWMPVDWEKFFNYG